MKNFSVTFYFGDKRKDRIDLYRKDSKLFKNYVVWFFFNAIQFITEKFIKGHLESIIFITDSTSKISNIKNI